MYVAVLFCGTLNFAALPIILSTNMTSTKKLVYKVFYSGCPRPGKIRENREFCEKKIPAIREFGKMGKIREKSGKFTKTCQGNIREFSACFIIFKKSQKWIIWSKLLPFFYENHLNYLYMSNFAIFWTWSIWPINVLSCLIVFMSL